MNHKTLRRGNPSKYAKKIRFCSEISLFSNSIFYKFWGFLRVFERTDKTDFVIEIDLISECHLNVESFNQAKSICYLNIIVNTLQNCNFFEFDVFFTLSTKCVIIQTFDRSKQNIHKTCSVIGVMLEK